MKLTAYPKTIFCLALLLCWGSCAPPAVAQSAPPWHSIAIVSPLQTVEVHTRRLNYISVMQYQYQVYPNGTASGFLSLNPTDRHPGGVLVAMGDGSVRFNRDGTVAAVIAQGRTEEGNLVVVMITPAASEDCLIYTTVGSDVNATWEAQGRLIVIR